MDKRPVFPVTNTGRSYSILCFSGFSRMPLSYLVCADAGFVKREITSDKLTDIKYFFPYVRKPAKFELIQ